MRRAGDEQDMSDADRRRRFEATVLVHLDAAFGLARWILRDDAMAEDAVQDACLRAFRFFDGMLGPTPKAWFMAIVRNACLDSLAATRRRGVEQSFEDDEHSAAQAGAMGEACSPESLVARAADVRALAALVDALPEEFREVLVLREFEGLSYREISSVVGVPIGTVMSRLARARERLTRQLQTPVRRQGS